MRRGEVFGVLGPNGAGKTTMLQMLATLLPIDGGRAAEIFGVDVRAAAARGAPAPRRDRAVRLGRREPHRHREPRGSSAGCSGLSSARDAKATAADLLARFGLEDAADRAISQFSGGMRRRLDLAASLISRPPLIFLDEPTTGLDPRTRGQMWETIRELVREGCTVLLTTQYLDEADQLADRIAVIDRGRKVAEGTPDELKSLGRQLDRCSCGWPTRRRPPRRGRRSYAGCWARSRCSTPEAGGINVALADANRAADVLIALRQSRPAHRVRDRARSPPSTRCSWPSPATAPRTRPTPQPRARRR